MKRLLLIFLILLWVRPVMAQTALATVAAGMSAGTWAEVTGTGGFTQSGLLNSPGDTSNYTLEYSNKWTYDSVNKQFFFFGGAHAAPCCYSTLVKYDETGNTWSILGTEDITNSTTTLPCISPTLSMTGCSGSTSSMDGFFNNIWISGSTEDRLTGHSYQHNAIDPTRRVFYVTQYDRAWLLAYNVVAGTWSRKTDIPTHTNSAGSALEYFPERDRLVAFTGDYIQEYNAVADTWSTPVAVTYSPANSGSYDIVAVYSAHDHCIYFGGGHVSSTFNHQMWKYDENATITAIANPPIPINSPSGTGNGGIVAVDPNSGDMLYWGFADDFSAAHTYQYDPAVDSWSMLSSGLDPPWFASSLEGPSYGTVAVAMPNYGVIAFIDYESGGYGNTKFWLYKHANDTTSFAARCAAAGVVRCFSFDTTADLNQGVGGTQGAYGGDFGVLPPSSTSDYSKSVIDTSVFASGGGALRFDILSNTGSDMAGSFFTNFSTDRLTQFGEGEDFYVQFRQRFSPCLLYTGSDDTACLASGVNRVFSNSGAGGWKQALIGDGDPSDGTCTSGNTTGCASSCSGTEMGLQNTAQRGFMQLYNNCGIYTPLEEQVDGTDFYEQNALRGALGSSCRYHAADQATGQASCFHYYPNEWMTFQLHIKVGTWADIMRSPADSVVEAWIAREGQPSVKVHGWDPVNGPGPGWGIYNPNPSTIKYGKIWLLPYHTGKDATETHPTMHTWYDELIISTNRIADPTSTGGSSNGLGAARVRFHR